MISSQQAQHVKQQDALILFFSPPANMLCWCVAQEGLECPEGEPAKSESSQENSQICLPLLTDELPIPINSYLQ